MAVTYNRSRPARDQRRVWRDDKDCERLTRREYEAVECLLGAISYVAIAKDDLTKTLERIPHGMKRINMALGAIRSIADDIIGTVPVRQCKQLQNVMNDMEIRMVPKSTPSKTSVVLDASVAMELTDAAKIKCRECTMDGRQAMKCSLYKLLEGIVPLMDYGDGMMCPYALAEWEEKSNT